MIQENINKKVAHHIANIFGGKPKVNSYYDDNRLNSIDILSSIDNNQLQQFSTVNLNQYPLESSNNNLRLEIAGISKQGCSIFGRILSSCAFNITKNGYKCYPGAVFKNIVDQYTTSSNLKHILFVPPFYWKIENIETKNILVTWLQIVPISEHELNFAIDNGVSSLEDELEANNVDVSNINRKSLF